MNTMFLLQEDPCLLDREFLAKDQRPLCCLDRRTYKTSKQWAAIISEWRGKFPVQEKGPWIWTNYGNETGGSGLIGLAGEILNLEAWEKRQKEKSAK